MIRQFEIAQQAFHMFKHLVQCGIRILLAFHPHDFHLVELVQTVKPAHVLAVRTCFAAETWRICRAFYREAGAVHYHVAENIGHGYFRRRYHVEVVHLVVIHLAFLVGQLARTVTRSLVYHMRRLYLGISGGSVAVQEKVYQSPLKPRAFSLVHGEACSGYLHTEFKVDYIIFLGQFPVRHSSFEEFGNGTFGKHFLIVFRAEPLHHQFVRHVRYEVQQVLKFFFSSREPFFEFLRLSLERCRFLLQRRSFSHAAGLEHVSYLLGQRVELCQIVVQSVLRSLAGIVQQKHFFYHLLSILEIPFCQPFEHLLLVLADKTCL